MCGQFHQNWRQEAGNIMRKCLHKSTQSQNTRVKGHQFVTRVIVTSFSLTCGAVLLELPPALSCHLYPHLAPQLCQQLGQFIITDEARVKQSSQYLSSLLPDCDVTVCQQ